MRCNANNRYMCMLYMPHMLATLYYVWYTPCELYNSGTSSHIVYTSRQFLFAPAPSVRLLLLLRLVSSTHTACKQSITTHGCGSILWSTYLHVCRKGPFPTCPAMPFGHVCTLLPSSMRSCYAIYILPCDHAVIHAICHALISLNYIRAFDAGTSI